MSCRSSGKQNLKIPLNFYLIAVNDCITIILLSRKIYLVVDGGALYYYDTIQRKPASIYYRKHKVYVPLSIFGPYLFREDAKGDRIPAPMSPSPYCSPRVRRRLPVPLYANPLDARLRVDIPQTGHSVVPSNSSNAVQDEGITVRLIA